MKQIKSIILTLLTALLSLPATAQDFTYEGIDYTVLDEEAATCKTRDGYAPSYPATYLEGDVVLPSKVSNGEKEYTLVELGSCSFTGSQNLLSITIPETVTKIAGHVFGDCKNLVSVDLPQSVIEIGDNAFKDCNSLANIELPNHLINFGACFSGCSSITSIDIPDGVEVIKDGCFRDCISLQRVGMSSSITEIEVFAFERCVKLETITFPSSLAMIEYGSFWGCVNLSEITYNALMPVEVDGNAFEETIYANTTLRMPNAPLDAVKSIYPWNRFCNIVAANGLQSYSEPVIGQYFKYEGIWYTVTETSPFYCKTRNGGEGSPANIWDGDLEIPSKVMNGEYEFTVTQIGDRSFTGCDALTSISLPSTVTYIGEAAFQNCLNLTTIGMSDNLDEIRNYAFAGCENLASISFPDCTRELGWNTFAFCKSLKSIVLPASLEHVGEATFKYCTGLESITFNEGLKSIGFWGFRNCTSLKELNFPNSLTDIGELSFQECSAIERVTFGNSLARIHNHVFVDCSSITSLEFPVSLEWIGEDAFGGCSGLTSVTFPSSFNGIAPRAFERCTALESIVLPEALTEIREWTFTGCTKLKDVKIPDGVSIIRGEAFKDCSSLSSITLPPALIELGGSVFNACTSLESIKLPSRLTTVGEYCFYGCSSLKNICFPATLESIGYGAFGECEAIMDVEYLAETPVSTGGFSEKVYEEGRLTTPNATLADVLATDPWRNFWLIIAKDGSIEKGPAAGEDFEYEGLWYTVLDPEAKTVKTRDGSDRDNPGNHFEGDLIIPSSVSIKNSEYSVVEIGHHGFSSLPGLTSLMLPITVRKLSEAAFENCENLTSIKLPDSLTEVEGWVFNDCVSLTSVVLPEGLEYVGETMFAHCHSLTSATLPTTIKEIRGWAFGDANLTSINLPEGLETIGGEALTQNRNLASITFPSTLTAIWDRAFSTCAFTSLILPESLQILGDGAFYHCYELESIVLPASLNSMGRDVFGEGDGKLFYVTYNAEVPISADPSIFANRGDFYETATLTMPNATLADIQAVTPWNLFQHIVAKDGEIIPSLKGGEDFEYEGIWYTVLDPEAKTVRTKEGYVEEGDVKIPANNCAGQLVIPEKVYFGEQEYTVTEIGYTSFARNLELTNVILPPSITRVSQDGFYGCPELTDIQFSDNLLSIGQGAFYNCEKLASVNLPASLQTMDWAAFIGCRNISTVNYYASEPVPMDGGSFDDETYSIATLNAPNASLADIRSMEPWNRFRHITAKDGSAVPVLNPGEDFEYEGLVYTVLDSEARTVQTKAGHRGHYEDEWNVEVTYVTDQKRTGHFGVTGYTIPGNNCEGDIEIPSVVSDGEVEYTVIGIGTDGFHDCVNLKSVKFPETLQFIGEASFEDAGLTSLNLPNSLIEIVHSAFISCDSLKTIVFPESLKRIGDRAFYSCNGIESLSFPREMEEIGWAVFDSCYNIRNVTYNAELPVRTGWCFTDEVCENATLHVPNASLADIRSTECWNLFRHIIAKDGTSGFVSSGDDFEYDGIWYTVIDPEAKTCMTKGQVYDYDLENYVAGNNFSGDLMIPEKVYYEQEEYTVVEIGVRSFKANELTSVSIPETVTVIPTAAFEECRSLTSVQLPESLTLIKGTAFQLCTNLSSINWPSSLVTIEAGAFNYCGLTSLDLPEGLTEIGQWAFQGNPLVSVSLPASLSYVETSPFNACYAISEVNYPAEIPVTLDETLFPDAVYQNVVLNAPYATVADIKSTTPWNLFRRVIATNGSIGFVSSGDDFEYEGVWYTVIDSEAKTVRTKAGYFDYGLQAEVPGNSFNGELIIPAEVSHNGDIYTVIEVGDHSFASNDGIVSVVIPESVDSIGEYAFISCHNLLSVSFPASLSFIGIKAFRSCEALTEVTLPDGLTVVSEGLFYACGNLREVHLPSSITEIGFEAFTYDGSITSITLPESLKSIGGLAFYSTGITSIDFPETLELIDNDAFFGCPLSNLVLPNSLREIGWEAFGDCYGIERVSYGSETPIEATDNVFEDVVYENAVLETPNATLSYIQSTIPWSLFRHVIATNGSIGFVSSGDDFEYEGIWYTVIDPDTKTAKTKDSGNTNAAGDVVIPESASDGNEAYTVVAVGEESFRGAENLNSVTLPATISTVGLNAFADCERLASLVWTRDEQLNDRLVAEIANPNLLLYVNDAQYAPEGMTANVVAAGVCDSLVLTPGHAFAPVEPFTARKSSMTKEFRQRTPIGGTAGWETIVLPFDVHSVYAHNIASELTSFAALTDVYEQRPYWLYQADPRGEWKHSVGIQAGIPYLLSTPNNPDYPAYYNVDGPVTFSSDRAQRITPETTAPYAVTWASGREFRSLWLPLTEAEAAEAMGLNANVSGLTDDNGLPLAPGSAFHIDVTPQPLEAYVTRLGAERAMRIMGQQSGVLPVLSDTGLDIRVEDGAIHAVSATDRTLHVFTPEGILVRTADLKAGEETAIKGLTPGIYLIAGRKLALH